jgi:hypothetical protein
MAFQFVNVTPEETGHDAETKRRIRSQAMRDYRRRQRLDDENDPTIREETPSSISSPQSSSASLSRQQSRQRKGSTQSLPVELESPERSTRRKSGEVLPSIEDLEVTAQKRPSAKSSNSDELPTTSRLKRRREPKAQHGVFGSFTVNLEPPQRPRQPTQDADLVAPAPQLEEMLSICEAYNGWLTSSGPMENAIQEPASSPDTTTSQMILYALCLKSIGHLESIDPRSITADKYLFKTRVLALVNTRLKDPAKALDDQTIGALACLTSYEISSGSTEAMMHLSGLSQIVRLRGGISSLQGSTGVCMLLEM